MEIEDVVKLFAKGRVAESRELVQRSIDQGEDVQVLLNEKLIKAMEQIGEKFSVGELFLPEMMVSARCMQACLAVLKPELSKITDSVGETVVIGTVQGDLHDIGKNLVALMLEGGGFTVFDIGVDVSAEKFVLAAKEHGAKIVCLSSLLTTTMARMRDVIDALRASDIGAEVKILVGGAPVSQDYADRVGADGFAPDAGKVVKKAKEVLGIV